MNIILNEMTIGENTYVSLPADAGSQLHLRLGMIYLNILHFFHCYPVT